MAYFAQLNENNIVIQVIVVTNKNTSTDDDLENENLGIAFCRNLFGETTKWKQTSYNARFRKNFAGIGYEYSDNLDAFIPPKPYIGWILNEDNCRWYPPISHPDDGFDYIWNEETLTWDQRV